MGAEALAKRGMNRLLITRYLFSLDGLKNSRQKFDHAPSQMIFLQLDFPLNGDV